jgi:hypothetical protein
MTVANTRFASGGILRQTQYNACKLGASCFYLALVHLTKFSAENPRLCQVPNRCKQFLQT